MDQTHEYETLYIISPELNEEEQNTLRGKLTDVIKNHGGEIVKDELWGKRRLAYPIKKKNEGVYVLVRSKGKSTLPEALNVFAKRTPELLRHLTTLVTPQQISEEARQVAATEKKAELARIAAEEAEKRMAQRAAEEAAAAEAAAAEAAASAESTEEAAGSPEAPDAAATEAESTSDASGESAEQKEAVGE